jgi:hypothetical protein
MKSTALIAILISFIINTTFAADRNYLIFDSANEYALAWGCSNFDVDFARLDRDDTYLGDVLSKCDINNYVINLYENRIVETKTDVGYFTTRNSSANHFYVNFASIDSWVFNVVNTFATVDFYTVDYAYKWESSQEIMVSVVPYNNGGATQAEVYTCTTCSDDALKAMLVKTGWDSSKTEDFAWNIGFESVLNIETNTHYLVAKAYGSIPKDEGYTSLKADIDLTFDYATKTFSIKVAKLLESKYVR